jgi:pyruvate-ferredoxin/flavodoxin oxidoreductase
VQSVMDMALIAQTATLESRIPFVHFFDGFRTSHEVAKVEQLTPDDMRAMITADMVRMHRERSLNPDRPVLRGTAQNPDVYFQARETVNRYYDACPETVQRAMDRFAFLTGRQYRLFDYYGAPDAERVVVLMGSSAFAAEECVDALNARGERVGIVNVHLFRPFSSRAFVDALPPTVRAIGVLDRTKEPGSLGDRAAWANRFISMWSPPFTKPPASAPCLAFPAGVTDWAAKSSHRRWPRPCSRNFSPPRRESTSWWASTTM